MQRHAFKPALQGVTVQKYLFKLILKSTSKFSYGVVATSFFLEGGGGGSTKRIKNVVSLEYFAASKFSGYKKKIHHIQDHRLSIKCGFRGRRCILIEVVRIYTISVFTIDWKLIFFSLRAYTFYST